MKNKNVMYVLLVVSLLNVLQYLANNQYESTIFFCAIGFLTAFFSKNMSVVMSVAILGTMLFRQSEYISKEGLDNKTKDVDEDEEPSVVDVSNEEMPVPSKTENFATSAKKSGRVNNNGNGNADLAQAENLLSRLEQMMGKLENFSGMFGGGKQ